MDRTLPHDQRWGPLKEIVVDLYMRENLSLPQLAKHMKEVHGFDAHPPHYRHRLKSWGIRKRITTNDKEKVISKHGKRSREDASTSDITLYQGGVEKSMTENRKKQLRRYITNQLKHEKSLPPMSPGILLRYNLPYPALRAHVGSPFDKPSPFSHSASSPFVNVNSPEAVSSPQPPLNAPSPTTQLVRRKARFDRADHFIQGQHSEMLRSLDPEKQRITISWLHDLWMFSFMTAKYWGRGPRNWTADQIAARSLGTTEAAVSSPSSGLLTSPGRMSETLRQPTQLCRWAIHHRNEVRYYERIPSPPPASTGCEQNIEDETTWTNWPHDEQPDSLSEVMRDAITSSKFSAVEEATLPISASRVASALKRSNEELEAESLVFAIMAGNEDLVLSYRPNHAFLPSISKRHPFHLAAAYLHGSKACCLILDHLVNLLQDEGSIGLNYRNDLGHTVLDSLLITIIRCHTAVSPSKVCKSFGKEGRFPGEGVDICGRWDADSPYIRRLYECGRTAVPMSWKHPFCHTSAQAICHSITAIFSYPWSPPINSTSGIFTRTCGECREELKPGPLHTLTIVAFFLANDGTPGETLFGAVATLTCLLAHNADPLQASELSLPLILSQTATGDCEHEMLTPYELALRIPGGMINTWSKDARLGWSAFLQVLQCATLQSAGNQIKCYNKDYDGEVLANVRCGNPDLGLLWAAVQAELATYRRLTEKDDWVSANFDMQSLECGLRDGSGLSQLPLFAKNMLRGFSPGGWYGVYQYTDNLVCPTAQDICSFYIMNMEDWGRTTFIASVDRCFTCDADEEDLEGDETWDEDMEQSGDEGMEDAENEDQEDSDGEERDDRDVDAELDSMAVDVEGSFSWGDIYGESGIHD